ncbi:helix-turn-helix transcriptional regulator [Thalassobaculum sp. OXR-137]|uniref:helix-turn-helix domain-containing protein n=1 Tax=Thalassobaculum sp. OXR-137 TaxID=3100173 RepID=UPI002AC92D07|nr:helix-turn-helix transcriptional regulator [Thalassobaculum sp. OXR-137]WPZ36748.1 helix-turn-helix transcriptional regulator [Thalassobaculum sp. OXR-137]
MNRANIKRLNGRLAQVMLALADGGSYKSIAKDLGISPATVNVYVTEIYRLLAIKTQAQIGVAVEMYRPQITARAIDGKPAINRKEAPNGTQARQ